MSKSLAEIIFLSICKLRTFFVVPSARIVRFPIDIRGKKFMDFGRKLTTGVRVGRKSPFRVRQK